MLFPLGIFQEIDHLESLKSEEAYAQEDLRDSDEEYLRQIETFKTEIDTLELNIQYLREANPQSPSLESMQSLLNQTNNRFQGRNPCADS